MAAHGILVPLVSVRIWIPQLYCGMVQRLNIFVFETRYTGSSPVAATILGYSIVVNYT